MQISVPAIPGSIDILRSVAAAVAGHTPLGYDRVDDLRLAVSEGAARLIRASAERGTILASVTVDAATIGVELSLRDAAVEPWPIGPEVDPFSWIVIQTLTDEASESLAGSDPSIRFTVTMP
jgi:serine/threonine-protein kinase RsbW